MPARLDFMTTPQVAGKGLGDGDEVPRPKHIVLTQVLVLPGAELPYV